MRISEFFKRTGNNFAIFCQKFFGDNPEQYVEATDDGTLVVAAATGNLSKATTAELVKASRDAEKNGNFLSRAIDASVRLDSDDNGYNTTSFSERETSYRDSEAMRNIRNRRNDTSAKNLPNIPREIGGEDRTKVGH